MRRVKQKDFEAGDCGIACAAMVAGCTYEQAHSAAVKLEILRGETYYTSHADLQRLLGDLGVSTERRRFESMRETATPAIVKVNPRDNGKYWHWVVLVSRAGRLVLLDPKPERPGAIESFRGYRGAGQYLRAA
jgi:ABC-type bacteriocin/lantibiotic exporter with double-glycine peptidase domain